MNPTLVAFDTSTDPWVAAVSVAGEVRAYESEAGLRASARLVPQLFDLLRQAGVGLAQVDAIAYGRGPGAFTGLRTACSVAQGLALGSGKPVLAIDTLLAVAEDARAGQTGPLRVWVVMDARMDEIYAAHYGYDGAGWSVLDAPRLTRPDWLRAQWQSRPPQRLAGTALAAFGERLPTAGALCVPEARPRGAALLRLARVAWDRRECLDAAQALPLYLRDEVALTTVQREQARAARVAAVASP